MFRVHYLRGMTFPIGIAGELDKPKSATPHSTESRDGHDVVVDSFRICAIRRMSPSKLRYRLYTALKRHNLHRTANI